MTRCISILVVILFISLNECSIIPFEFQTLDYTPVELSFNQDIDDEPLTKCCTETASFNFRAYGREFPLRLSRSCQIKEEVTEQGVQFSDEGSAWQGKLEGEPNSTVDGHVVDGIFEGIIITGDGLKFMVERRLLSDGKVNSLIYKLSSRKQVLNSLFPEEVVNDEGSGIESSGFEIF